MQKNRGIDEGEVKNPKRRNEGDDNIKDDDKNNCTVHHLAKALLASSLALCAFITTLDLFSPAPR